MWPDDEWDDEPASGSLPDPSTRHWRHPSEIGAQNAMAASAAVPPTATPAAGGGWRWTAGAITGGFAVVALGVLGLTLADTPRQEVLTAGSIPSLTSQAGNVAQTVRRTTTSLVGRAERQANGAEGVDDDGAESPSPDANTWAATTPTTGPTSSTSAQPAAPTSAPAEGDTGWVPSGQQSADGQPGAGNQPENDSVADLVVPANGLRGPYGPAVYAERNQDQLLGSFVSVDNQLLTSGSVLAGRHTVYLLIDELWVPATVAGTDPLTDVAVLEIDPAIWALGMPSDASVAEAIGPDTKVFIGYCPDEVLMAPAFASPPAGCGPVEPAGRRMENEATAAAPPGEAGAGVSHDLEARTGTAWSVLGGFERVRGRKIHDLIRTGAPYNEAMAGAAMRSMTGDVVGLVVSADNPSVVAVPIDRALQTAHALRTAGRGGLAWLGIETVTDGRGVLVATVDEFGPGAELMMVGDRVVAVDNTVVIDVDHFTHLVRSSGPGASINVTVIRGGEAIGFEVTIGDITDVLSIEQ